jgi:hypothetical protein
METDKQVEKNKGGRPPGSLNKMARDAREQAALTGDLPHEFLLRVARGEVILRRVVDEEGVITTKQEIYDFERRVDAAKAAAPYYAPKISTVEVISGVSDADLDAIIARAAAEAGISIGPSGEGAKAADQEPAGDTGGSSSSRRVRLSEGK